MISLAKSPCSFFLATARSAACKEFYQNALDLELREDSEYALVFQLADAELRISKVPEFTPFPWTVLDWQVANIDEALGDLKENGVEFVRFDGMDQDERGVWTVPGDGTKIAWFKDPDGNVLSISQRS